MFRHSKNDGTVDFQWISSNRHLWLMYHNILCLFDNNLNFSLHKI